MYLPLSDITQHSYASKQTAFIGGRNAGLASDAIVTMISLRWLYLLWIWKEGRIYPCTDEAHLGTIESAYIFGPDTEINEG